MVLRRAALGAASAFIYADTDCACFSCPVKLPIDPKIYGRWKIEVSGAEYAFITKKVYFAVDAEKRERKAKGMLICRDDAEEGLRHDDFERWWEGSPPKQTQVQRASFLKVMTGGDMFVPRTKVGQRTPLSTK